MSHFRESDFTLLSLGSFILCGGFTLLCCCVIHCSRSTSVTKCSSECPGWRTKGFETWPLSTFDSQCHMAGCWR